MRHWLVTFTGLAAALVMSAAMAHAFPKRSVPGAGQELQAAPVRVDIWFDEKIEPLVSKLVVKDASGGLVSARAKVDGKDPRHLSAALKPLAPGKYRVFWKAVGHDGHKTQGDYSFTVAAKPH